MKTVSKIGGVVFAVIVCTVTIFMIGHSFGERMMESRLPEEYLQLTVFRDPELIAQIERLRKRLAEETPEKLGLLTARGVSGSYLALPRSLLPAKLPIGFWPTDDTNRGSGYPEARVDYGNESKARYFTFETSRVYLFVAIEKNARPSFYSFSRKIWDAPLIYVCYYD